ncbi:thioredoxin family protein [Evansella tamaricis]|uniref:Thioredoxin family protein n=1 Tax=Evansella tamaricis TaxID=2069301 RepID=A0ABS6JJ94_9BACI|nr:thioredoxin family protein [Evansella tamaricis]MBU9713727.1 thioredoxin family protein [Evansella tamaricis]
MKELKSMTEFQQAVEDNGSVFMFSAGWCPDCVVIEPHLPDLEKSFPQFTFYKVNRDHFIDLCQELNIFGIPSFLVYKDGVEVQRFVSKDRKTKEEIEAFLKEATEK